MPQESCPVKEQFKTMIGGQALIEGIMMRGPDKLAVVVRKGEELVSKVDPLKQHKGFLALPLVRGLVGFLSSLVVGTKALMYSAEQSASEDEDGETPAEEPSKFDQWLEKKLGSEKFVQLVLWFGVLLGLGFSILLFFLLPMELGNILQRLTGCGVIVQHLLEGVFRIVIFIVYMYLTSKLKDMQRVFRYHGAEHKTIRCYEARLPLTVENVSKMTRKHPRCGTSFLFVIMTLSILLFTVLSYVLNALIPGLAVLQANSRILYNLLMMAIKLIVMLPLVVSITFEINRVVGRHDNRFTRILTAPGLWFQNFTTQEPDESMMEVAIEAVKLVLPEQEGADRW